MRSQSPDRFAEIGGAGDCERSDATLIAARNRCDKRTIGPALGWFLKRSRGFVDFPFRVSTLSNAEQTETEQTSFIEIYREINHLSVTTEIVSALCP
jgi:hypothetical protein